MPKPHPPQGEPGKALIAAGARGEPNAFQSALARGARLRPSAHEHGRQDRAHDRSRTSQGKDWPDEPRVQHQPIDLPGADGHARIAGERRSSTTRAHIAVESSPLPGQSSSTPRNKLPAKPSKRASHLKIAPRSPKTQIFRGARMCADTLSGAGRTWGSASAGPGSIGPPVAPACRERPMVAKAACPSVRWTIADGL